MEAVLKYSLRGRPGLKASEVGFGCGSVGGLPVRGEYPEMRRAVARALEPGISQFDTASLHGDGQSEVNLGAVLPERGADPIPGTKARLEPPDPDRVEAANRFRCGQARDVHGPGRHLAREQPEEAVACADRGRLPGEALGHLPEAWTGGQACSKVCACPPRLIGQPGSSSQASDFH